MKINVKLREWSIERIESLNKRFNRLSSPVKKTLLLLFGLVIGSICLLMLLRAIYGDTASQNLNESITIPKDTYMKKLEGISENKLNPIGKLKGEVEGEFEAFYLAMDDAGQLYINRSLPMTKDAYDKANGWEKVSRRELKKYEEQLHFIPHKSKRLHR